MKQIKESENAVVGIVAAFLIVGLIVAVLSVVQTQYVPKWMEEREAEHMDELADKFSQLKYAIDIHSSTKEYNTPISTSITLGSKEMPFLMSTRAFGQIEVIENGCTITINDTINVSYPIGIIKYSSSNAYFINQDYIYECGSVILSQHRGNAIFMKPSINLSYEKTVTIYFNIVNISTIGGKKVIAGYGTYPIQTEFQGFSKKPVVNKVSSITIDTKYVNAWHSFLNSTLLKSGFTKDDYNTGNYTITSTDDKVTLEFNRDEVTVNVEVDYIQIGAQIAPGWIENIKQT